MIEHRFEAQVRVEDAMCEGRIGGGALWLVTVCLCDGPVEVSDARGEPVTRASVVTHLRPSEACELVLLELAELAERRTEAQP